MQQRLLTYPMDIMQLKLTMKSIILIGMCFLLMTSSVEAFILENNCLAPPPCECSNTLVYCVGASIYHVPKFLPSTKTLQTLQVELENNNIRLLLDNDFQMLQTAHAQFISMNFASNDIEFIEDNAFSGIENFIRILLLDLNRLSYVPPALGKLINLSQLSLKGNPLTTFDPAISSGFGSSLSYFTFNINFMSSWPTDALNNLQVLQSMGVVESIGVNSTVPLTAFDSFKNTLTTLNYQYDRENIPVELVVMYTHRLPEAVCRLSRLRTLRINSYGFEYDMNGKTLFEQCRNTIMTSVESLSIFLVENLNMTEIFTIFPSLRYLVLNNNFLYDLQLNPYTSGLLTTIDISFNTFATVPADINTFTSLVTLDIGDNFIKNITEGDFSALVNLETLDLSNNMITFIHPSAFKNNIKLESLTLEGNNLATIPTSVMVLSNLKMFTFSSNKDVFNPDQFECSCQTLGSLKAWNVDNIYFPNHCKTAVGHSNPVTIKSFIQNDLSSCP